MSLSFLDQMMFPLRCGHMVVLGRLNNASSWICESCRTVAELTASADCEWLSKEFDSAYQCDAIARERGALVARADEWQAGVRERRLSEVTSP